MSESASVRAFGKERSPISEAQALTRPRLGRIAAELLVIGVPAAVLISVISAMLASRQVFLGFFGDPEQFLWIVDNLKQTVARGDLVDSRMFFGTPTPLAYNVISPLTAIPTLIAYEASGSYYFAYNFVFLSLLLLNFCSMYTVLRLLRFNSSISFLFGAVFLLAPNTMAHALGHITLIATFLLPPYLYVLYRLKAEPRTLRYWIALGVITGGYVWAREELGLFVIFATTVIVTLWMRPFWKREFNLHFLMYSIIVAALAFPVVALYLHRNYFDESHGIESNRELQEVQLYSPSPANYLFPSDEGLAYQHLPVVFDHVSLEHLNYLGLVNIVGIGAWLYYLVFRRDLLTSFLESSPLVSALKWELLLVGLVSFLLSLGPVLELNGSDLNLPLKLGYKWHLPVIGQVRAWSRFGIFAFVAATFLSAHLFRFLLTRYTHRAAIPLIASLILIVVVFDQYPIGSLNFPRHKTEVPTAVNEIKADQDDSFVLHVPLGVYTGAQYNPTSLFFQLFHGHPIVNGYTSIYHQLAGQRMLSTPLICFNYPDAARLSPADPKCEASTIAAFLSDSDIGYIVYEKQTRVYVPEQEDAPLRKKSLSILSQLTADGTLEVFYDDPAFTFYRRTGQSTSFVPAGA